MAPYFDRLKAAWDSNAPHALDRAAERLAAEGVAEVEIMVALEQLLLEVRAAGADDETEERIMGVYDRLTGWCHESNHIRTSPANGHAPASNNGPLRRIAPDQPAGRVP